MPETKTRRNGHATGMAGEFFTMEKLFRLGHLPALTLGNAKSVDILVKKTDGRTTEINVKAICGGGKWGVDDLDARDDKTLVYVLLWYRDFDDPKAVPDVYVVPAAEARRIRQKWFNGFAIYCSNKKKVAALQKFRDAWHLI